jgi:hypothetical protein
LTATAINETKSLVVVVAPAADREASTLPRKRLSNRPDTGSGALSRLIAVTGIHHRKDFIMRGPAVHTRNVPFRVSEELFADIAREAAKKRMSVPEYLRDAVRRALGDNSSPAPLPSPPRGPSIGPSLGDMLAMSDEEREAFEATPAGQEALNLFRSIAPALGDVIRAINEDISAKFAPFAAALASLQVEIPPMPRLGIPPEVSDPFAKKGFN